ncbi:hypothetical protein cyc_08114 [Cyclospora cayetanensis]|uniref:Uncharacterized protein n=1 Tax=Cyclospora cayetanensis TaxID=88456 RepID=A0A1D3CXU8_9EIME|nr:hypothetical protein cyc_08114 [Cyclospora cayetanensis]
MARHSKNATSAPFYSYHERKKIRGESLGLMVSVCVNPIGSLPQCIGSALLQRMSLSELRVPEEEIRKGTKGVAGATVTQTAGCGFGICAQRETLIEPLITSKEEARAKNFWVPENTPDEPEAKIQEPQKGLCCPITGASLRIKQLVKVKPNLSSRDDTETTRWLCALSGREISHQKAAVVKSTGQVILLEYLEKLVFGKKGALTSGIIEKKDTVTLVSGGTGTPFAGVAVKQQHLEMQLRQRSRPRKKEGPHQEWH